MDRLSQLTEDEFEHIEEEISRTAKGRAFLRRFRRQALGAATEEIRAMLEEFRLSWRQQSQAIEAANRINVLRQELIEMAASIERARQEIAALQPADADNNKIISATSELDAIVISTERASFEILNAAEKLMELSSRFRDGGADPELCSAMDDEVNSIFTACSFQDLTGQRTGKVVNALRYIEQRINAMIGIWGATEGGMPIPDMVVDTREDAHLLNGPQHEGKGVSQSDVDAMFSFDGPPASEALDAVSKLLEMAGAADSAESSGGDEEEEEEEESRFNQADIDALMNGAPPPPPPPPKPAGKPQSQSDIDALFGADPPAPAAPAPPKAKQNQSDIDSMFDA
ncbi:MAG: protein phosphatase CheZ, partial [Rhodospirillaceae bacterium]